MPKAILIAAPASGAGKTTVALGLMAALQRRGLSLQPFKCGPDFIDAGLHARVCGRPARNLDLWMLSPETNLALFARHAAAADVAVVEGVMGLFDGARAAPQATTAGLARLLRIPVLLVVDASRMAGSVAALVRGFAGFDPALNIAGVILNQVGGEGHYRLLCEALAAAGCPPALGYLPADPALRLPERHLGLHTAAEGVISDAWLAHLADAVERGMNLERILALSGHVSNNVENSAAVKNLKSELRIAIARDAAFSFYYEDNLDALRDRGAEIVEFRPCHDAALPENIHAIYLGGGYPELHAAALAANVSLRRVLAQWARDGGPIYAECGGLIYLAQSLTLSDGQSFPMAGVLPVSVNMTNRLQRFGYCEVRFKEKCLLGSPPLRARGHSFHTSRVESGNAPADFPLQAISSSGETCGEGCTAGPNVLASYIHLHFLSQPELAENLIHAARNFRDGLNSTSRLEL